MLEKVLGWKGTLSEPSTQWHDELKKNRPFSDIITDCIWSESGKELNFFISDVGILSTLDAFINMTNLSELQKLGLININTSTLKITSKGLPVLNTVINKLLI